ncbi:MAG: dethiobiotin synthase [Beijerinckiaceae bacterium]|nr:dethiobiotin synthase [Beijerinckiaceae bacterium]
MPAAFITGTGTGVGKTFVATGLIHYYRRQGQPAAALKPIVSGFDPAASSGSDPALLLEALGRDVNAHEVQRISPWRYRAALSPDMAARAEGRSIGFEAAAGFCRTAIAGTEGTLLIEGIGGVMVPLNSCRTVLDLMIALDLPVILVAGSYLGTLSHTLCAQDVILRHGLELRAIVVSESEGAPPPLGETLTTLANFCAAPLIGLERKGPGAQSGAPFQRLAEFIG